MHHSDGSAANGVRAGNRWLAQRSNLQTQNITVNDKSQMNSPLFCPVDPTIRVVYLVRFNDKVTDRPSYR